MTPVFCYNPNMIVILKNLNIAGATTGCYITRKFADVYVKEENEILGLDNADNVFGNIYLFLREWSLSAKAERLSE